MKNDFTVDDLIRREVFCCASSLIYDIDKAASAYMNRERSLDVRAGLRKEPDYPWDYEEEILGIYEDSEGNEVFEHWIVSPWLGEKLKNRGEKVFELSGLTFWGRTTTGQQLSCDQVFADIHKEIME